MTPERWQQIDRLLELALEQESGERADFLAKTGGGDEELRREVEALLQAHDQAGSFISSPAPEITDRKVTAKHPPRLVGQVLDLLVGASRSDNSLDVACGPGVVACHFASVVKTATGIDITPAMIEKAKSLEKSRGLNNV